jgi:hypothetical protein
LRRVLQVVYLAVTLVVTGCFYVESVDAPETVKRKKDFEVTVRLKTYEDYLGTAEGGRRKPLITVTRSA